MGTSTISVSRGSVTVPADFAGNHFNGVAPVASQAKRFITHDAAGLGWYQIHTAAGTFNWSALDAWVASLPAGAAWTYVVWGTPSWCSSNPSAPHPYQNGTTAPATDISSSGPLAAFVTALCQRYPTLVLLEVWNEPDVPANASLPWWSGTVAQFVTQTQTIYNAVKAVRSSIKVLGPCCVYYVSNPNWLAAFLSGGGLAYVDAISLHGYEVEGSTPVNAMLGICHALQYHDAALSAAGLSTTAKDLHCTEFGQLTPHGRTLSDADYIASYRRAMLVAAAAGLKQACWYAYDDATFGYSGRPAVESAIAAFITLICGATISGCVINMPEMTVTATINDTSYTV